MKPTKTTFSKYLPLIVIFLTIIAITVVASILKDPFSLDYSMRIFMGAFFAVFGFFKIINLKAFAQAYRMYDVIAKRSQRYALSYPFIELILAGLYIANIGGIYRDIFTLVIMSVSAYGVYIKLQEKEEIPCACLGMVFKVPMTYVTFVEDILMAVMALGMILM